MSIEKTFQGAYKISQIYKGYLVSRQYFGYTKKQAISLFKQYLKTT